MAFNEDLPEWNEAGVEPPQSKKNTGWQVDEKPPAGYFNWFFNRVYKCLQETRNAFTAGNIAVEDAGEHFTAEDVEGALEELFTSVSNGKTLLETAVIDMASMVSKAGDVATFAELDAGVRAIGRGRLPNLLKQGSFENYLNCWDGGVLDNEVAKYGYRSCKLQSLDGVIVSEVSQAVDVVQQHKYYASGWFMRSGEIDRESSYDICDIGYEEMDFVELDNNTMPTANIWHFLSGIAVCPATATGRLRVYTFNTSPVYCDGLMLIDLSAAAVAAAGMKTEQINANVQALGGWWDSVLYELTHDATASHASILKDKVAYVGGEKVVGVFEGLDTSDATAVVGDLLTGKTAYTADGKITGTMANQGQKILYPRTYDVPIPAGYHNGNGFVQGEYLLEPEHLVHGYSACGVVGTYLNTAERRSYFNGSNNLPYVQGYASGSHSFAPEAGRYNLTVSPGGVAYLVSDAKINLTDVKCLVIEWEMIATGVTEGRIAYVSISALKLTENYDTRIAITSVNEKVVNILNVGDYAGEYYIKICVRQDSGTSDTTSLYLYKILLA